MEIRLLPLGVLMMAVAAPGQERPADPAIDLSGMIVAADTGAPIERFRILPASVERLARDVDARDGRFSITGLAWPRGSGVVTAAGFAPMTVSAAVPVPAGSKGRDLSIRMARGGTLRGRVESEDGKPVAGARLMLADTSGRPLFQLFDEPPSPRCGNAEPVMLHQTYPVDSTLLGARTAEDGTWSIEHVPAGDYRIAVDAPGRALHLTGWNRMKEGASTECPPIRPPAEAVISGTIPEALAKDLEEPWWLIDSGDASPQFRWRGPIEKDSFVIRRLPPGIHTVSIFDRALFKPPGDLVRILKADTTKKTVNVDAGVEVRLTW